MTPTTTITGTFRRFLTGTLLGMILIAALALSASAQEETEGMPSEGTVTITDHADRTVTVPTDPDRVVILDILPLPSVLTVFLGSSDTILAMEPASMNAAKNGIVSGGCKCQHGNHERRRCECGGTAGDGSADRFL